MDPLDDQVGGPKNLVGGVHGDDRGIITYPRVAWWREVPAGEHGPGRRLELVPQPLDGGKFVDVPVSS
jgi:hypothetical protein